ncbi:MAG: hypothetical protein ACHBN1_13420 [Heteroscytonema crispum UTEX LB 1556]
MDWFICLQELQKFLLFRFSEPPYFLLFIGLLTTFSCGLSFFLRLRQLVEHWSQNFVVSTLPKWEKLQLLIPFLQTASGVCIVLAFILETFGLPTLPSYLVSLILTVAIASFVWSKIGINLARHLLHSYFLNEFAKLSHLR